MLRIHDLYLYLLVTPAGGNCTRAELLIEDESALTSELWKRRSMRNLLL